MLELDGRSLTYEVFQRECLAPNRPAIIRHADQPLSDGVLGLLFPHHLTREPLTHPDGSKSWFYRPTACELLSPQGLLHLFGSEFAVPAYRSVAYPSDVTSCSCRMTPEEQLRGDPNNWNSADVEDEKPLRAVLDDWAHSSEERHYTYLKDFHFQATYEKIAKSEDSTNHCYDCTPMYVSPDYLGPDYLNTFCLEKKNQGPFQGFGGGYSDYRFAYIGPPGTQTLLHFDVFGSYSWSFNVYGRKRWFFPSEESNAFLLRNRVPGFPLPPDIRVLSGIELVVVEQNPGDLLFVPARYLHQVHNISGEWFPTSHNDTPKKTSGGVCLTVSLNHNWCNTFNLETMTELFLEDVRFLHEHMTPAEGRLMAEMEEERSASSSWLFDALLQRGSNWSFASMILFLQFCVETAEKDESASGNRMAMLLLKKVKDTRKQVFAERQGF